MSDTAAASSFAPAPNPPAPTALFYGLELDGNGVVLHAAFGTVAQVNPDGTPMTTVSADLFASARAKVGRCRLVGGALQDYTPPAPSPAVPASVTRLQGRLALSRASLLAKAEAAVAAAGGETAIWYADAQNWDRTDPHVAAIATALGLASADIDNLFTAAGAI